MDDSGTNRNAGSDPNSSRRPALPSAGSSWGIPVGIAALFLLAGVLAYYSGSHGPDRAASGNASVVIQTNPSGPERPTPAPAPKQ